MAGSVLVRAARQQGQRRVLAWRQALAGLQLPSGEQQGQQQQQQQLAQQQQQQHGYRVAAGSCLGALIEQQLQQQQPLGSSSSGGRSHAATAAWHPVAAWPQQQQQGLAQHQQQHQLLQQRWYAIGMKRWQPRRKDGMPDRNLPLKNEQIRAPQVRVLFPDEDKQPEVMPLKQAISLGRADGLDVVMVNGAADPPVVRLVEWSKVLYEKQKKEKLATKQKLQQLRASEAKEVRIGCQIAEHDLQVKMAQARRFLDDNYHLRLVVTFKGGGQIALGRDVTLYLIGQLADIAKVKDEKHLQRPMRGHWAVLLTPLPPPAAVKAAPPPRKQQPQEGGGPGGEQQPEEKQPLAPPQQQQPAAAAV